MRPQHLSDEAVAAYADDALANTARERARRHCADCPECAHAVAVQREAVWALRGAPAPALPSGLLDRLRAVPATTPVHTLPTALAADGTTLLATHALTASRSGSLLAPVAAFAPATPSTTGAGHRRARHIAVTAAALAVAGALTAGSTAHATSGRPQQVAPPLQPAQVVPAQFAPGIAAINRH